MKKYIVSVEDFNNNGGIIGEFDTIEEAEKEVEELKNTGNYSRVDLWK